MRLNFLSIVISCFLLSGCAAPLTMAPQGTNQEIAHEAQKQRSLLYKRLVDNQIDIHRISYPIMANNAPSCAQKVTPDTGIMYWNIHDVPTQYRHAAYKIYKMDNNLQIMGVAPNSPAMRAGLRPSDLIISVNGQTIPRNKNARRSFERSMSQAGYKQSQIVFKRNGTAHSTLLIPEKACAYPVILINKNELNAMADGENIIIFRGMLRFAENDDEIALVIAHEMAHNTMGHIKKKQQNAMVGSLGGMALDIAIAAAGVGSGNQFSRMGGQLGALSYSVAFEQEADYVGMYYLAQAGYNTKGVADFWRRMATEGQSSINHRTSHPSSPERFLSIERTHNEINRKKVQSLPLIPNIRPKK